MTFSRGRNIVTPDPADYQVRLDVSISSSDATLRSNNNDLNSATKKSFFSSLKLNKGNNKVSNDDCNFTKVSKSAPTSSNGSRGFRGRFKDFFGLNQKSALGDHNTKNGAFTDIKKEKIGVDETYASSDELPHVSELNYGTNIEIDRSNHWRTMENNVADSVSKQTSGISDDEGPFPSEIAYGQSKSKFHDEESSTKSSVISDGFDRMDKTEEFSPLTPSDEHKDVFQNPKNDMFRKPLIDEIPLDTESKTVENLISALSILMDHWLSVEVLSDKDLTVRNISEEILRLVKHNDAKSKTVESKVEQYKTRLQEEEGVLEGVKNELEDKERIIMELTHQLQKKDENLRHFDNDYSSKIEQLKKKNTLLNEQINRLKSYSKENNELKRKIESFEVEMREKQVTAEELDDEKNKMRLKLDDLRDKLSIVSEKEVSYKQELENLSQKLSINEKELALRKKRSAKYREASLFQGKT